MQWNKKKIPHEQFEKFKTAGYTDLEATVLCNSDIHTLDDAKEFLSEGTLHDTNLIEGIDTVADIIYRHIYRDTPICIFGDYDADGVTASAVLYLALKQLQANVSVRLPDRINEGYGITIKAIKEQMDKGIKLFITVDNGIRAIEEVKYAREHGAEVIVLDHHEPGKDVPDADALIDLHMPDCSYPFIHLTGSGLAWKVAYHLLAMQKYQDFAMSLIDLAAIGTIADVETLQGENRAIVKRALQQMHSGYYDRQGIINLYNGDITDITAEDIAFRVAPCINAAGRLLENGAVKPFELLIEEDLNKAITKANELISINEERKAIQKKHYAEVLDEAKQCVENGDKVLVMYANDAPTGVVGLIAGNLRETFNRPAIVFAQKNGIDGKPVWTGSARSIPGFSIINALNATQDKIHCFLGYGGHEQAAGMSISPSKSVLMILREEMNKYANDLITDEELMPHPCYDMEISEQDFNERLIRSLKKMEPFGVGCPKPIFKMDAQLINKDSKLYDMVGNGHLKLYIKGKSILGFDMFQRYEKDGTPRQITAYGTLSENHFGGKTFLQFMMEDYSFEKKTIPKTPLLSALSAIEI